MLPTHRRALSAAGVVDAFRVLSDVGAATPSSKLLRMSCSHVSALLPTQKTSSAGCPPLRLVCTLAYRGQVLGDTQGE